MRERAQHFDPRQNMHNSDFEIFHYREPKPNEVEVHHHDFYEVYFFLNGEVEYWVEGRIFRLLPGDLLLINPMELHRPIVKTNSPVYERIVLWIDKEYLKAFTNNSADLMRCFDSTSPTHTNLLRPAPGDRADITTHLGDLVRESYSAEFGANLAAQGLFLQFMVKLNRLAASLALASDTAGVLVDKNLKKEHPETSPLIARVLSYINEHYGEPLSLDDLSQRFFVSKYHLSHEFSKAVGTGLYRYITLKRLLIAKQMLSEGLPPGEVYGKCGFKDYTNFFRAFKAEYGISPSACMQ